MIAPVSKPIIHDTPLDCRSRVHEVRAETRIINVIDNRSLIIYCPLTIFMFFSQGIITNIPVMLALKLVANFPSQYILKFMGFES